MGEIDKKHINEFIKGQMTEYIYIALSDLVLILIFTGSQDKRKVNLR